MRLTREQMLDRMTASDPLFDGRFIVGVHSTGIYCRPSCRARLPKPENVIFYETIDEARAAGLRACKKCRPDEFAAGIDPDLDRLESVVAAVRAEPSRFKCVEDVAYEAAMSPSALFAGMRTHFGTTPGALLSQSRVSAAQKLLRETTMPVGEVALAVGFEAVSAFYDNFRRRTGMPPAAFRRLHGASEFCIELPAEMPLGHLMRYLSREPGGLTERVTESGFEMGLWAEACPCLASVSIDGREALVRVTSEGKPDLFQVHEKIVRVLGLTSDPRPFEEAVRAAGLGRLYSGREGTRIPQSPTPFDGLVWSIVGQQVNIAFATTLRRRITELAGRPLGNGMYAPPTAESVSRLEVDQLVALQFSRRKAEYVIGAATSVATGELDLDRLLEAPPVRVEAALLALRGIGPWSANYLMMRALGCQDCVPIGDTGLTSALARFFDVSRPDPKETIHLMEVFRPYRSLATYHLWHSLHQEL